MPTACRGTSSLATIRSRSFAKHSTRCESWASRSSSPNWTSTWSRAAAGGRTAASTATSWLSYDPYKDGLPEEIEQKQAEQYVELFKLFDENSDIIERVSFWNLHDGQSWLNYFPWRRVNYPLLFDRNRSPKPVFDAVYTSLQTP